MKCEYNNNISDEFAMYKTINLILFDKFDPDIFYHVYDEQIYLIFK